MATTDSYIIRRHTVICVICTVFITYPNVMWIPWNLARLHPGEECGFWAFLAFRIVYFFCLFYYQLEYNFSTIHSSNFIRRFGNNLLFTFIWCALFVALSYGLPLLGIQTGYVGNILLFQFFVACLLCTFIGYIASLDSIQRRKEQELEQLRIENLQSRCNALVNQINPHFFFNSLNGISSLVRRGDDDSTLEYITRLSDIFRYILQSDRKHLATLKEEMDFLEAFSHVMLVRFSGKLNFHIDVGSQYLGMKLPVLSLLPLLENITVHNRIDSSHIMNVNIVTSSPGILVVENTICPKLTRPDSNGTGLSNLNNRFILLTGKSIEIKSDGNIFKVSLPLTSPAIS